MFSQLPPPGKKRLVLGLREACLLLLDGLFAIAGPSLNKTQSVCDSLDVMALGGWPSAPALRGVAVRCGPSSLSRAG